MLIYHWDFLPLGFSARSHQLLYLRSNRKLVIHLNLMQHNNTVSRLYHFNPRNQNDVGQPFTFHLSLQDSSRTDPWFGRGPILGLPGTTKVFVLAACGHVSLLNSG